MAKVLYGDFYRYDCSPIWNIHHDYFLNTGIRAWAKGEVPYTGVSSDIEALKKASLFLCNLKLYKPESESVRILELGAGYGEFAKNFLIAFKGLCEAEGLGYFEKLRYVISDFSQITLDELKASDRITKFNHADKFDFVRHDVREASNAELGADTYDLILANYLLDQLPARVIHKEKGFQEKFFEKYTAIENTKKNIKKIKKKHQFKKLDIYNDDDISGHELEALLDCFRPRRSSTVVYSYGAIQALKNFLSLIHRNGIVVCSDFNAATRAGQDHYEPCYYGNSLALGVNFELLFRYFDDSQKVLIFEDPIKPLHTLILTRPDFSYSLELGENYQKIFNQNWWLRVLYKYLVEIRLGFFLLLLFMSGYLFVWLMNLLPH